MLKKTSLKTILVTGGAGFAPAQLLTAKRMTFCYCSASYAGRADQATGININRGAL